MAGHPIFASVYDRLFAANEEAGLREIRARLLASASGRTLEIGAGTGLNLAHYSPGVTELVLTEPDPHMAKRLRRKVQDSPPSVGSVEVIEAGAQQLPFEDGGFDTVVCAIVLCTVPDPRQALAEVNRVLRPGGRFLYIEHVRDQEGTRRASWQDRLARPWGRLMGGCHPNRDTRRLIAETFHVPEPDVGELPGNDPATNLIKPLITGEARGTG